VWLTARRPASGRKDGRADLKRRGYASGDKRAVQRRELRYGSWEFHAASDLARCLPYSPSVWALTRSVLLDPALIRVFVAIWRLPVARLRVQRPDADAWSEASPVGRTISGGRLAQAVLELPIAEGPYLAGRPKQALRTNLRHARNHGVTCDRIPSYEAWFEAASFILHARHDGRALAQDMNKPSPGQQVAYYVARDANESPLAFARVALLGQFAVLLSLISHLDRSPSASWARYQLHTFLALNLGCSGVKYLIVGSALREPAGNQYFQHLLGYRARNLRVEVIESGTT
jgi:hypothetical protein